MKTCRDVIAASLQKLKAIAPGESVLADQLDIGLTALQSMYDTFVLGGAFGKFRDVVVTADYTALEQDRVFVNTTSAVTITLPDVYAPGQDCTYPDDIQSVWNDAWYAQNAGGAADRLARDLSAIIVTVLQATNPTVYIRDGVVADWINVRNLQLTDEAPLSSRDFYGLSCRLAVELADSLPDVQPGALTVAGANAFMSRLSHKPASQRGSVAVDYF